MSHSDRPLTADYYTVLGTGVLVIDELTGGPAVPEKERPMVVQAISHPNFGVACGVVAFLIRRFNRSDPEPASADPWQGIYSRLREKGVQEAYLVRLFLPSGLELAVSGTAFAALAEHLYRTRECTDSALFTGYSHRSPGHAGTGPHQVYAVYRDPGEPRHNVETPGPRRMPERYISDLYAALAVPLTDGSQVEVLRPVVALGGSLHPVTMYAVYNGEPHLVCFAGTPVASDPCDGPLVDAFDQPVAVQGALFQSVADFVNGPGDAREPFGLGAAPPADIFNPDEGVSLVFARVQDGEIDSRFFRRGGNKETRMSGTGAAAAVAVALELGLLQSPVEVRSWLNVVERRYESAAVQKIGDAWWLNLPVKWVWSGQLAW